MTYAVQIECQVCDDIAVVRKMGGRNPVYCSDACKRFAKREMSRRSRRRRNDQATNRLACRVCGTDEGVGRISKSKARRTTAEAKFFCAQVSEIFFPAHG